MQILTEEIFNFIMKFKRKYNIHYRIIKRYLSFY